MERNENGVDVLYWLGAKMGWGSVVVRDAKKRGR